MANFGFEKIKRSNEGEVTQNQLYVTYDQICQCDCLGCRNKGLPKEEMESNRKLLNHAIMKNAEKFRHIIFGGGEPLYQIDHIVKVTHKIKKRREKIRHKLIRLLKGKTVEDDKISFSMTTNGERNGFLGSIDQRCWYCHQFDRIILSRYHYDDHVNDQLFRANGTLMTAYDIRNLCGALRNKMQLSCLCQEGGIQTSDDILHYIEWGKCFGIKDIMFSNYQQDITPDDAKRKDCDTEVFKKVQRILVEEQGYELVDTFVFSAGYKISTYRKPTIFDGIDKMSIMIGISLITGRVDGGIFQPIFDEDEGCTISFREFITEEEIEKEWSGAKKRTYNYSAMPNGAMYADWSCKNLI